MAMVELAAREGGGDDPRRQVSLAEIAAAQHISLAYLEQLFGPLRRSGLVASARGPGGGYRLARTPAAITIAAIVDAVDEPIQATRCEEGGPGCLAGERCLTHDLWAELGDHIRLFLQGVTLADVVGHQVCGRAAQPRAAQAAQ
jgi:Rrf2 family iron-sulfur cluster assembly transcriptional regulator